LYRLAVNFSKIQSSRLYWIQNIEIDIGSPGYVFGGNEHVRFFDVMRLTGGGSRGRAKEIRKSIERDVDRRRGRGGLICCIRRNTLLQN
jgi:hypothetical protein